MANHYSALKRIRTDEGRTENNRRNKTRLKNQVRTMRRALASKDHSGIDAVLSATFAVIDRSAKKGIIKKNTAARYKSRLHSRVKAVASKA